MKFSPVLAAAALTLALSAPALADGFAEGINDTPSAAAMAADLVLVRPLGLVATVAGLGLFVLDLPLTVVRGEAPTESARALVGEPARYTFFRRLGSMDYANPGH